ncbi:MFS transporter [Paraburkholderia sabiae]|uniref:MFS transporter n=1 Tax=Paraburkholderia sabiae TaxID=273251 RepID=A0ABU9QLD3_9BURK|nr:MFS transporter [Paraburkholderia sabiae]WJZ79300.1 MFS transporter [Paraburkholderia sabiae]CAD6560851.1 Putative tartrate transporter [Paraburkholderia sabiae]
MKPEIHTRTMGKVSRRLIPFMIIMFLINFLDRVNIGFAALEMNKDLGLSPSTYGFAAGILFIGYVAFEVPSNMILQRVGARVWLARIMITWGILATLMAFVFNEASLFTLRALIGVAEAGFFPGLVFYMMRWFPAEERAKAITVFMLGNPISVIIGGPLSTAILHFAHHFGGFAGWQWLFIIEGIPAIIIGAVTLVWLTERPEDAKWLEPDEREWLVTKISEEARAKESRGHSPVRVRDIFVHGKTLAFAFSKFCVLLAFFGITLWLPQIVKSIGTLNTFEVGVASAIPYVFSAIASVLIGRHSDKTGERKWHIALPAFLGAAGFVVASLTANPWGAMAALCVAATGLWVSNTVFWTLPSAMLSGTTAAAGIAFINAFGNLGGFVGPYLTGWIREATHSYVWALAMLGGFLALSGIIVLIVGRSEAPGSGRAERVAQQPAFRKS